MGKIWVALGRIINTAKSPYWAGNQIDRPRIYSSMFSFIVLISKVRG